MKARAIANNDIVYLWWTYDHKIPDCLGFSVRRIVKGKKTVPLPAFVGFDPPPEGADPSEFRSDTDHWPIQSYQWKDLFVPEDKDVSYEIVPLAGKDKDHLKPKLSLKLKTGVTRATESFGPVRVAFNRGIISTQALAHDLPKGPSGAPKAESLMAHIKKPGDGIRNRLAGDAIAILRCLLERARQDGGTCYLALYELTDPLLIDEIEKTKGHVELILSNADGSKTEKGADGKSKTVKVYDKTNAATRKRLHKSLGAALHDRLLPKGNYIGHNKFAVYADASGAPKAVLTGSTNWTPTGLCAQSNNALIVEDAGVAGCSLDYWRRLLADDAKQAAPLRTADAQVPADMDLAGPGTARIWFSPNTQASQKPKDPPCPADMAEVFERIRAARDGVLFLVFSPGSPSIVSEIRAVAEERRAARKDFFVRGAISDAAMAGAYRTRVYNDSILDAPNQLITGIAGVPDAFAFWEKELAKLGHAVIHDKIVVIDPFRPNCCVITGSHTLGYKASYSNDENFAILSGDSGVVEAYAAHVLDVVNHYNWRESLKPSDAAKDGKPKPKPRFDSLCHTDAWQDKYFRGSFLASRDRFFFPD